MKKLRRSQKSHFFQFVAIKNLRILLFIGLLFHFEAFGAEKSGCIDGKIRYFDHAKEIVMQERYCYDSLLRSLSSTKKCLDNKECLSNLPGPFLIKIKDKKIICEKLNGIPQLIEFWDKESWIKTSRCIFNDGSYIDIPALKLKIKLVH